MSDQHPLTPPLAGAPNQTEALVIAVEQLAALRLNEISSLSTASASNSTSNSAASSPPPEANIFSAHPISHISTQVSSINPDLNTMEIMSPQATAASGTFFGATTGLLSELDRETVLSRKNSKAPTRAPSVTGIGNTVGKPDYSGAKIVVAMVGLPARGKSYLSNKLMRYLQWLEYNVQVFNVGQLRRRKARDTRQPVDHSSTYFDHSNQDAKALRERLAAESLETLISWLKREGNVGIHDATNSTRERRAAIEARVAREPGLHLLFLESVCDDPLTIAANIALKVQSGDPDYKNMTKEAAETDFKNRIAEYERVYEQVDEPHLSYCKVINVGQRVHLNRINGYLESRVAFYLMNLHLKPRAIFLSRHGESMFNVSGQIGGDAPLSPRGQQYSTMLPGLVKNAVGDKELTVWTSTLLRTNQTAQHLPYPKKTWKSLDELDAGVCDAMTYEEIAEKYPEDYASRDDDKFNYRYRGGESYRDVVVRLEPVIMELERQENILVIAHQAVIRCLYAYFMGKSQEELPYIKVPLHTLIKLTPKAYGCEEELFKAPIDAVDTHRAKPPKGPSPGVSPHGTPKLAATLMTSLTELKEKEGRTSEGSMPSHSRTLSSKRDYFGETGI